MPDTEAAARHDPALVSAYDRYTAMARHHDNVRRDPHSTATARFEAALAVHKAFQDFLTTNAKPAATA